MKLTPIFLFFIIFLSEAQWERSELKDSGINPEKFSEFVQYVFEQTEQKRTNALVVIHKGKLIFEQYARGFHPESKFRLWSISKTISALIFARAIKEGLIGLDEPVASFFPKVSEQMGKIKVRDLMNMSSGIEFEENYINPMASSTIKMLYGREGMDITSYLTSLPMQSPPGEVFRYSSGDTNFLMALLRERLKQKISLEAYQNYPWTSFFQPLQIEATFETDSTGLFIGSSYVYMSARDLAKVGELLLRQGRFNEEEFIPREFIEFMSTLSPGMKNAAPSSGSHHESYGAQIWLNQIFTKTDGQSYGPYIPSAPESLIIGRGYAGQGLYMFPHKSLIVIRLAHDKKRVMNWQKFGELILNSFEDIP